MYNILVETRRGNPLTVEIKRGVETLAVASKHKQRGYNTLKSQGEGVEPSPLCQNANGEG